MTSTNEPAAAPDVPAPVTLDRIAAELESRQLLMNRGENEIVGQASDLSFVVSLVGAGGRDLRIRARAVAQLVNDWNRDRIMPKAFTEPAGDAVMLVAELTVPVQAGLTDAQLTEVLAVAVSSCSQFMAALESSVPAPARPGEDDPGAGAS